MRFALLATATLALTTTLAVASGCQTSYRPADAPAEADASGDGTTAIDASTSDGGLDSGASCSTDLQADAKNCGRCGHDCLGGTCSGGRCTAIELGQFAGPLTQVVVAAPYVYVSTLITDVTQAGGLFRVPTAGGPPEALVPSLRFAEAMAVVGDKLYFVVQDTAANGVGTTGGLYSCPLAGAAPCTPTLIAPAQMPAALTVDQGRLFYGDDAPGKGLMVYEPPGPPTVFRAGFGFSNGYFVDGNAAFYLANFFTTPAYAEVIEIAPDGGTTEVSRFTGSTSSVGASSLIGDKSSVFFAAFDETKGAGVVRRISRTTGTTCDFGGIAKARPAYVHADGTRVYWSNRGTGTSKPWVGGSIESCDRAGCCTTPDTLWTGNGEPTGVAGDDDAIYFVTRASGTIWKVAKP